MSQCRSGKVRMTEQARVVLSGFRGRQHEENTQPAGVRPNTVDSCRHRFARQGLSAWRDAARPGTLARYGKDLPDHVLAPIGRAPKAHLPTKCRLGAAIHRFTAAYDRNAARFVWRNPGSGPSSREMLLPSDAITS